MTANEKAWLAGLLDGEGCITINRQYAASRRDLTNDSFRLYVQITMGDRSTLDRCLNLTKVGSVQPHTPTNKKANQAWCWMTSASDAEIVLKQTRKYIFTKRDEVSLALAFRRLPSWQVGGSKGQPPRPQHISDEMASMYWRMRILKPRWRFYRDRLKLFQRKELQRLGINY